MDGSTETSPPDLRASVPGPSSESVRSKTPPPLFSHQPGAAHTKDTETVPGPGSESVRSRTPPPLFSLQPGAAHTDASVSGPSFESVRSRTPPPLFSLQPGAAHTEESPVSESQHSPVTCPEEPTVDTVAAAYKKQKQHLVTRCESVTQGFEVAEDRRTYQLKRIYTELYITETLSQELGTQHDVRWLEAEYKKAAETPIRCHDIFKPLPTDQHKSIRVVLTSGVAGVGKTFSVLKFTLDWAEGLENQEVDLVVPLSFRELNLVRERHYSLSKLIHDFHPALQELTAGTLVQAKLLFIFDGLDEYRLPLDFNCEVISDVRQTSQVNVLLVNLIRGSLLPSALIWITSRPAAANQIHACYVHRLTEVRGFTDDQKEQYFRKMFTNKNQCDTVLSHIKTSKSLHIMCQIPVFCWITAKVLDHMLRTSQTGPLPQTLTDMYAHFLLVQTHRKRKYSQETSGPGLTQDDCEVLLKLGRLAFEHLEKGNIMFYQEDLEQVGLDLTEASVYSGLCTEIIKQENIIFHRTVYCFVHLSVQEFLAAIYMHHCFNDKHTAALKSFFSLSLDVFLKKSVEKSFEITSGHLDLFVRFLHGLSVESNQRLLKALLGPSQTSSETTQRIIENLRQMNTGHISANGSITVFYCLIEMNDHSVHQQILDFLKSELSSEKLSNIQSSYIASMLQMSAEVLGELNVKRFTTTAEGKWILVPPDTCREATRLWYGLSKNHCEVLASNLKSSSRQPRELDLWLQDDGSVKALCDGLKNTNCQLEILRLHNCRLSEDKSSSLASALQSNPCRLRQLDLSWNEDLSDSGVEQLCGFLQRTDCRLEILRLEKCQLSKKSCSLLASALKSNPCHLKELDVTENELKDSGVEFFCDVLQRPDIGLEHLRLDNCGLSESSCASLASALKLNPSSNLRKLDLSVNNVKDPGVEFLCGFLQSPNCRLEAIELKCCGLTERSCFLLASALKSNPSHLKDLRLNWNKDLMDAGAEHLCVILENPLCRLEVLRFRGCSLTGKSCASLASALESNPSSTLSELDLCENSLTQADVERLMELQLKKLEWEEEEE